MTPIESRPNVAAIMNQLKDFQRDTADYVFQRLYTDPDHTRRFLIADEVGLGKTLVARGLIAKAIDRLWDEVDRIDVVYICSNADIARQNVNRLNLGQDNHFALATRITLLPKIIADLKKQKVNFVSFTPGTSFDLKSHMGIAAERAVLFTLLQQAWGDDMRGAAPINLLCGDMQRDTFERWHLRDASLERIEPELADRFVKALRAQPQLRRQFTALCQVFTRHDRKISPEERVQQLTLISELRALLAGSCLTALEPDLIILDEFQRFKHLLKIDSEAGELAGQLFNYADSTSKSRVLLLSATPYKMYTMSHEADTDDHYADFVQTLRFLQNDDAACRQVEQLLTDYRHELLRVAGRATDRLQELTRQLETQLRKVMVRTERLAATDNRDGMLVEIPAVTSRLAAADLKAYVSLEQVAEVLEQHSPLEYWKSAPYLLNFMEDYKLKQAFETAAQDSEKQTALRHALQVSESSLLPWSDIEAYARIDPRNARLRGLLTDTLDTGAWQLLWIPPALPYYQLTGPYADPALQKFTKRLVFSSWQVVPKVIATLLTYEAERQMFKLHDALARNTAEEREKRRPLLRFARSSGRLTGMPVLGLIYPCLTLADQCDPLALFRESSSLPTLEEITNCTRQRIDELLAQLPQPTDSAGMEDENWYWAAPLLLDVQHHPEITRSWLSQTDLAAVWAGQSEEEDRAAAGETDTEKAWATHVRRAQQFIKGGALELGRHPHDLSDVLTSMALGGLGVCSLRALWRVTDKLQHVSVLNHAAQVAYGFLTLFNLPDVTALIRGLNPAEPYWQRVAEYAVHGGLQAVLDEYAHVLRESLGLLDESAAKTSAQIASAMREALTLRTSSMKVDTIALGSRSIQRDKGKLRGRFALRFGNQTDENEAESARAEQVRTAFNSPFWPFVLATTSVGQEGLDFHTYCHAVVHWNLPANPVDLEQREGRVHRYKGHAVRKNLARDLGPCFSAEQADPWEALFAYAVRKSANRDKGLTPYWLYSTTNGAKIERHVPALPLSRDAQQLELLRQSLAAYRMVFGQSRQEDMLNFLLARLPHNELASVAESLRIDLSPRP